MAEIKFSKKSFALLDLPNLLVNVWSYCHGQCRQCKICVQYAKWCVEIISERWRDEEYRDFPFVINAVIDGDKNFCDFGRISSADRYIIYDIIKKP